MELKNAPPWPTFHICQWGEACPLCAPSSETETVEKWTIRIIKEQALGLEKQLRELGEERVREMAAEGWHRVYWQTQENGGIIFHAAIVPPGWRQT